MSFVHQTLHNGVIGVDVVEDVDQLQTILRPTSSAAIWNRACPADAMVWLGNVAPDLLPSGRVTLQAAAVAETVDHLCDMSGLPECAHRDWLQHDIAMLADRFADVVEAQYLRLRLQPVSNNACRKFHIDAMSSRLVCTYRGAGTQYGTSKNGDDPSRVYSVPTGSPILMKGDLWPSRAAAPLLHRSPPIEGSGQTRLVLVLDPVADLYSKQ